MKKNLEEYLKQLENKKFLKKESIGTDQVKALLVSASRNIRASEKNILIDEEACYTLAYNAMLKIARSLIFLQGYRPSDGQQHKTTVEVAGKILGEEFTELIESFDIMRKKRNQFIYDPLLPLSITEAKNAFHNAYDFYKKVRSLLDNKYPQLKLFD